MAAKSKKAKRAKRKRKQQDQLPAYLRVSNPQAVAAMYRSGAGKHVARKGDCKARRAEGRRLCREW